MLEALNISKTEALIIGSIVVVTAFIIFLPKKYILPAIIISPIPPIP